MKTINFDKDYRKLKDERFTTIRLNDKGLLLNDTVKIKSPSHSFKAVVTGMYYSRLTQIPAIEIYKDLDITPGYPAKNLDDCLDILKEYYPDITIDTCFYYYKFKKKGIRTEQEIRNRIKVEEAGGIDSYDESYVAALRWVLGEEGG